MKLENLLSSYKDRMQLLRMNQKELAKLSGLQTATISNILNGKNGSFDSLNLIENALYDLSEELKKPKFSYKERIEKLGKSQCFFARELGMTKQQFSAKLLKPKFERTGFYRLDSILEVYENEVIS